MYAAGHKQRGFGEIDFIVKHKQRLTDRKVF